jgi:hypothetical protein
VAYANRASGWFILVLALLLDPAAVLLVPAATHKGRPGGPHLGRAFA